MAVGTTVFHVERASGIGKHFGGKTFGEKYFGEKNFWRRNILEGKLLEEKYFGEKKFGRVFWRKVSSKFSRFRVNGNRPPPLS